MAQAYFYTSTAVQTQLNVGISNSATSAQVASTVGWPTQYPYVIAIDYSGTTEELCAVTANNLGLLTITRGFDNTSAQNHGIGAVVRHVYCGNDANAFRIHEGNTAGVHGITGNVVGDVDAQTLTNKTLTSPVITGTATIGTANFTGTATVTGTLAVSGNETITNTVAATVPLVIKGASSQSADLLDFRDNSNNLLGSVAPDGAVSLSPTGVAAGEKYFKVNSPSGAATNSQLINLSANGVQLFDVDALGKALLSPIDTTATPDYWKVNSPSGTQATSTLLRLQNNGSDRFIFGADGSWTAGPLGNALTMSSIGNVSIVGNANAANITNSTVYTPLLSGGALTLGNGTMVGRYSQAGGQVTVNVLITMGSTSTLAASGNLVVSLPLNANSTTSSYSASYYTKTSGGAFNGASVVIGLSATTASFLAQSGTTFLAFNTTNGGAVAAGSVVVISFTYLV